MIISSTSINQLSNKSSDQFTSIIDIPICDIIVDQVSMNIYHKIANNAYDVSDIVWNGLYSEFIHGFILIS